MNQWKPNGSKYRRRDLTVQWRANEWRCRGWFPRRKERLYKERVWVEETCLYNG